MHEYRLSDEADADLIDVWLYAAQRSPAFADSFLDRFYQAFQRLADMPGMGHRRDDLANEMLRVWPVSDYLTIYRLETDPLEIVRVVSGYRDIAGLLIG